MTEQSGSEAEFAAILARLRQEVATMGIDERTADGASPTDAPLRWRTEAQRHSGVTAERAYLFKPGRLGRLRGYALMPLKAALRRLMRWYVEPLATDQRAFNSAVLGLVDEVHTRAGRRAEQLDESLQQLEQRIARLESGSGGQRPR
jgi:hypothetical protein